MMFRNSLFLNSLVVVVKYIIYCLIIKKTEWEQNKHSVGLKDMGKYLTELKTKDEYFYLNDVHSKVLQ